MLQVQNLTLAELSRQADRWDDLWQRSQTRLPSCRLRGIQLWLQAFAPKAECMALVVTSNDQFVAALPLLKDQGRWPLTVFRTPSNCTVNSGDLLIDPSCNVEGATLAMARQIARLPGTLAAFENIPIHEPRWKRLIAALAAEGRTMHVSPGREVGVIDIRHDWNAYVRNWSGNHRSAVKRARAKLEAEGAVRLERIRQATDDELHDLLEQCFAIEHKSWKGDNGTSVLNTRGLPGYYHQEARMMRDLGALDLWLLKLNDQLIAFEYCLYAKGTCFSFKISFDPDFERFSPGKVLRCLQLEQYHQDPAAESFDTLGVLCESKAKWITRTYTSSRCFVAIGSHGSNLLLGGYKSVRNLVGKKRPADAATLAKKPAVQTPGEQADRPQIAAV